MSFQQQNKRNDPTELQEYFDRTNLAFITQLLRQSCQLLTNSDVYNTQFNYGILPDLLQYVKNNRIPPGSRHRTFITTFIN